MGKKSQLIPVESFLNTLGQNGTAPLKEGNIQRPIILNGHGSSLNDRKALIGRKRKKLITNKIALELIDIAHEKGHHESEKVYRRVYYCQADITTTNDLAFSKYCKHRVCSFCCGVRKAEILNKYLPVLQTWNDPHFLTLTVKSVPAIKLREWIGQGLLRGFKRIIAKYRKMNQRGKGIGLMGIRSLECNFNPLKKTYNPHFHIIVPNRETAEVLKKEWLNLWTKKHTIPDAQFIRPVKNLESDLIEIIKYSSKIFTDPEGKKYTPRGKRRYIYISALHNILSAMTGHRIFDRFGFNLPTAKEKTAKSMVVNSYNEYCYDSKKADWKNVNDPEDLLVKTFLPNELIEFLESQINKDLE